MVRNFSILYNVVRTNGAPVFKNNPVIIGTFETLDAAQDHADAWHQEIKDKDPTLALGFHFDVQTSIFYAE